MLGITKREVQQCSWPAPSFSTCELCPNRRFHERLIAILLPLLEDGGYPHVELPSEPDERGVVETPEMPEEGYAVGPIKTISPVFNSSQQL